MKPLTLAAFAGAGLAISLLAPVHALYLAEQAKRPVPAAYCPPPGDSPECDAEPVKPISTIIGVRA